uniref:Uncharacterized protein n=1 Tax=Rhizophora mucronata TaxID=61149 RepID=A0A2P2P3C0_RHIMU
MNGSSSLISFLFKSHNGVSNPTGSTFSPGGEHSPFKKLLPNNSPLATASLPNSFLNSLT